MWKLYKEYIYSDLYRYTGIKNRGIFKAYLLIPGFRYTTLMRLIYLLAKENNILLLPVIFFLKWRFRHYSYKYGIQIPSSTKIGKGFYIGHFGTIVVSSEAVIGDNVNISQGVTIGKTNRGKKLGAAIIGNEVYIGPGAKIVGKVIIGNNVVIGANAVVTHDIPDGAVVGGVPAKILSMNGSEGYVNRKI